MRTPVTYKCILCDTAVPSGDIKTVPLGSFDLKVCPLDYKRMDARVEALVNSLRQTRTVKDPADPRIGLPLLPISLKDQT